MGSASRQLNSRIYLAQVSTVRLGNGLYAANVLSLAASNANLHHFQLRRTLEILKFSCIRYTNLFYYNEYSVSRILNQTPHFYYYTRTIAQGYMNIFSSICEIRLMEKLLHQLTWLKLKTLYTP